MDMLLAALAVLTLLAFPVFELASGAILLVAAFAKKKAKLVCGRRVLLSLALVVLPTGMLLLSTIAFGSEWKGEKHLGWFGVVNEGWAGATILPLWLIAAGSLQWSLIDQKRLYRSRVNFLLTGFLAAVCGWYTFAVLFLNFTSGGVVLALVPFAAMVNLTLFMMHIWRNRDFKGGVVFAVCLWGAGLAATIWVKCVLAKQQYEALPDTPPDCFVVTAAAQGSPGFVNSTYNTKRLRMENVQLLRLQAFERGLVVRHPRFHRSLRIAYNRVGPWVARRIRRPILANATYLCLKPFEGIAVVYTRMTKWESYSNHTKVK